MGRPVKAQARRRAEEAVREMEAARARATEQRQVRAFDPPLAELAKKLGVARETLRLWWRRGIVARDEAAQRLRAASEKKKKRDRSRRRSAEVR